MPNRHSPKSEILDDLRRRSLSYSIKATQLSNLLEQAESFLVEMPGKVSVETDASFDDVYLSFDKGNKGWRLWMHFQDGGEWKVTIATQGTIQQKAAAAKHLPELYARLINHYDSIESEIDQGLNSLKELPFLDFESAAPSENQSGTGVSDDIPF